MAEILLAWIQHGLYPVGLVGRIRILLALQADAHVLRIGTMLVLDVQFVADTLEVTAVDLHTRLVGIHLHEDTGLGAVEAGADLILLGLCFSMVYLPSGVLLSPDLTFAPTGFLPNEILYDLTTISPLSKYILRFAFSTRMLSMGEVSMALGDSFSDEQENKRNVSTSRSIRDNFIRSF